MRGIPYSVNVEDIIQFYNGYDIVKDSIKIGKMQDGKLTGEATVLFPSSELA